MYYVHNARVGCGRCLRLKCKDKAKAIEYCEKRTLPSTISIVKKEKRKATDVHGVDFFETISSFKTISGEVIK